MPETDIPLKLLVREFAPDFAVWLLNVKREDVHRVQPLNVELPAGSVHSDTVFRVTLSGGRITLLHIEFQGRRSERPMPLRMLDYISRLEQREWNDRKDGCLCSVVIYVGDGAGIEDDGVYRVDCPDGNLTLAWQYRVVRLWQMRAEELLSLDRPALLTLVGQTRIEKPERVLPQIMEVIRQRPDKDERIRLFAALTSLMRDEEVLEMTEQLMETVDRDLMLDTPFLRRVRTKGRIEGLAEGVNTMRQSVLDILALRFDPPATQYRRIETQLDEIADLEQLRGFLQEIVRVTDVADFEQSVKAQLR
ncbi:MAG: hypothetical protein U9R15_02310 [Chloroflexota bacterium]|nr:hypothetical protein [Chloroflexota bacterium]